MSTHRNYKQIVYDVHIDGPRLLQLGVQGRLPDRSKEPLQLPHLTINRIVQTDQTKEEHQTPISTTTSGHLLRGSLTAELTTY